MNQQENTDIDIAEDDTVSNIMENAEENAEDLTIITGNMHGNVAGVCLV